MKKDTKFESRVRHPELLRVLMQIHQWECSQTEVMGTISARDLYLRLAVGLLQDDQIPQNLKLLQGPLTERATRRRITEFKALGLLDLTKSRSSDLRTKRAVPTAKFVNQLNLHMDLLMLQKNFVMMKKSKSM